MSPTAAATAPTGPEFFRPDLPLEQLRESPLNPRKHFDETRLRELADTFAGAGIIEPLVARLNGDHYEVICGARRMRAAHLAQLGTVPVIVKSLTDAQALEIMVIENNQREDVSPLEEAEGFRQLLATGYDLEKLAERLGRSRKYVYDRIKLQDLAPEAKLLLSVGKLTAGHAILLARLKPDEQARAIDPEDGGAFQSELGLTQEEEEVFEQALDERMDGRLKKAAALEAYSGVKPRSVRELGDWIAHHVRFRPQQAAAAAPLEFGDVAAQVEEAATKPGRGKKVISITFEHFVQPEARDESDRTFGPRSFKFADGKSHRDFTSYKTAMAKPCEHAVLGVVAVGEKYGQAFEVCIARDKCQVHWKDEIAQRTKNQTLREKGQGAKADKNEAASAARLAREREESAAREQRRELSEARALARAVNGVKEASADVLRVVLGSVTGAGEVDYDAFNKRFGTKAKWNCGVEAFKSLSGRALAQALVFAVLSTSQSLGDFERELKAFGVDLRKVEAEVEREQAAAAKSKEVQTSAPKSKAKKKR